MNNEKDMYERFEARIAEKKASQPKLHKFEAEFKIGVMAIDEEDAKDIVKSLETNLKRFDDISNVEGVLK